jgi:hypothetical protein
MIIPPPSFSFKGDKNKAMSLKSQALQLYDFTVRAARLGGINSISRTFTLSDGSTISFRSAKQSNYNNIVGRVIITSPIVLSEPRGGTSEIYMESGLVIYTATGCGALNNSYRPWKFRVIDPTGPQGTFSKDTFSFSGVLQGLESIAFGCRVAEQVPEVSAVPCGDDAQPITITEGGYCTTNLLPKKNSYLKVRPSVFSGLTRRYVQALYGSNKYDMEVDPTFFSIPHVKVPKYIPPDTLRRWEEEEAAANAQGQVYNRPTDKVTIYADFPECQFISRTATYDYFFISIRSNQFLDIYPMVFGDSGEAILNKLRSGGYTEDPLHLESYALSDAKPDTFTLLHSFTLPIDVVGSPIAFTWNSNSTGTKLTVVTHSQDDTNKVYNSREYSLILQITKSDSPSTFEYNSIFYTGGIALTQVNPDSKWNPREDTVWGHSYTYGMQMWFSGSWVSPGTMQSDPVCPIYSYYDTTDVKRVISLETNISNISASSGVVRGPYGCGPGIEVNGVDTFFQGAGVSGNKKVRSLTGKVNASRSYNKTTIVAGDPYVRLTIVGGAQVACATASLNAWSIYVNPGANNCSDAISPITLGGSVPSNFCIPISTDPSGGTYNAAVLWHSIAMKTNSVVTGEVKGAKRLIMVPFDDCCSVVYGIRSGAVTTSRSESILGGWAATQVGYQLVRYNPITLEITPLSNPIVTQLSGWWTQEITQIADYGYLQDSINSLGLNQVINYPPNYSDFKYTLMADIQDKTIPVISGDGLPLWLDSLINPSPLDLFHLLQKTANCTSDQNSNYSLNITLDQTYFFREGFNSDEIGAIGWQ